MAGIIVRTPWDFQLVGVLINVGPAEARRLADACMPRGSNPALRIGRRVRARAEEQVGTRGGTPIRTVVVRIGVTVRG
jgi:hypothetical protein